jgi:hypothetical protein
MSLPKMSCVARMEAQKKGFNPADYKKRPHGYQAFPMTSAQARMQLHRRHRTTNERRQERREVPATMIPARPQHVPCVTSRPPMRGMAWLASAAALIGSAVGFLPRKRGI